MAARTRPQTIASVFFAKASIQAFITIVLTILIAYGFATDRISSEALIGIYAGPTSLYFGVKLLGAAAKR